MGESGGEGIDDGSGPETLGAGGGQVSVILEKKQERQWIGKGREMVIPHGMRRREPGSLNIDTFPPKRR